MPNKVNRPHAGGLQEDSHTIHRSVFIALIMFTQPLPHQDLYIIFTEFVFFTLFFFNVTIASNDFISNSSPFYTFNQVRNSSLFYTFYTFNQVSSPRILFQPHTMLYHIDNELFAIASNDFVSTSDLCPKIFT